MKDEEARLVIKELVRLVRDQQEQISALRDGKKPLQSTIGVKFEYGTPKFWRECFG